MDIEHRGEGTQYADEARQTLQIYQYENFKKYSFQRVCSVEHVICTVPSYIGAFISM